MDRRQIASAIMNGAEPQKSFRDKLVDYLLNDSIPARAVQSAWSALTLPGDVYAGRVDPMSDEVIGRSVDFGGLMGLGTFNPASATVSRASKAVPGYNPPAKLPRPIEADYPRGVPADASGRITHDIEGRPLGARYVVGRDVVGQGERALGSEEYDAIATSLTREGGVGRAPSDLRGRVGTTVFDKYFRTPLRIGVSNRLNADQAGRVLGHEVGHVIDEVAGQIPVAGLNTELRGIYNTLNTGQERTAGLMGPQHAGSRGDEVPREMMAEAVRAYMADPNYLKTVAPKSAAAIRKAVNANPKLNRTIQFNASGVPMGLMGSNDE